MNSIIPTPGKKLLADLRQEIEQPNHGKPARFEVQFHYLLLEKQVGAASALKWWREEATPVIENLTGGRAKCKGFICYVGNELEAMTIAMFFRGFVEGVFDWSIPKWVMLTETPRRLPDL